jgi:endonuclease YncB( thermonuclease family)
MISVALAFLVLSQTVSGPVSVVDGDTIDVGGQRIRLHGIDAPESSQYCYRPGEEAWACGASATELMASLVAEATATCEIRDRDRYGRAIAICYAAGEELNAAMVRAGLALAYRQYSTDYVDEEEAARSEGVGLWGAQFVEPWRWRRGDRVSTNLTRGTETEAATAFRDLDCRDFATWEEAQDFFIAAGPGDPHRLDRNGDGIACESLR